MWYNQEDTINKDLQLAQLEKITGRTRNMNLQQMMSMSLSVKKNSLAKKNFETFC